MAMEGTVPAKHQNSVKWAQVSSASVSSASVSVASVIRCRAVFDLDSGETEAVEIVRPGLWPQ